MASMGLDLACCTCLTWAPMISADSREAPQEEQQHGGLELATMSSLHAEGIDRTPGPGWNSMKLNPPKVAAYWSWRPPASPQSTRSIS